MGYKIKIKKRGGIKMKEKTIKILIMLVFALLILSFIGYIHYNNSTYNYNCLDEYAKSYCEDNGQIFHKCIGSDKGHICCIPNERYVDSYTKYSFSEGELKDCIKKESRSWS